ncbi:vWA domain-containing protein [Streptomyces sp. NPDC002073]
MSEGAAEGTDPGAGGGWGLSDGWEERQPVVLLLDTSASMGRPADRPRIDALSTALARWFEEVRAEPRLRSRVEVCLLSFDSAVRVFDPVRGELVALHEAVTERLFVPVEQMRPPRLEASGLTRMTVAVEAALDLAAARYRTLQRQRTQVRRPFLWVLTDGAPSDADGRPLDAPALAGTALRIRQAEERCACVFQAIGVQGANLPLLRVLAPKAALMLDELDFGEILDVLFQSSDRVGAVQDIDEIHRETRRIAERRRCRKALEEEL